MTSIDYTAVEDFHDVEVPFMWQEKVIEGGESPEKWIHLFNTRSRDGGRSPMQWNSSVNGGFSTATPWQKTNGNYTKINVELQEKDEKSPLNFYRKLLKVRKTLKSVINGTVTPFDMNSEATVCYSRDFEDEKVISINNFKDYDVQVRLPQGEYKVLLTNYGDVAEISGTVTLRPYEGITAVRK